MVTLYSVIQSWDFLWCQKISISSSIFENYFKIILLLNHLEKVSKRLNTDFKNPQESSRQWLMWIIHSLLQTGYFEKTKKGKFKLCQYDSTCLSWIWLKWIITGVKNIGQRKWIYQFGKSDFSFANNFFKI